MEVKPHATWPLLLPFSEEGHATLNGATYDAASGRIYISQGFGDGELPGDPRPDNSRPVRKSVAPGGDFPRA